MSLFLLDTDTLTLFQRGHPIVAQNVAAHKPDELATSVISVEEQLTGWYSYIRKAKQIDDIAFGYQCLASNVEFLSSFRIVAFDPSLWIVAEAQTQRPQERSPHRRHRP